MVVEFLEGVQVTGRRFYDPNVTVKFKEYSASDYDTQLLTDLSSGTQPDVFPLKNLKNYYTYAKESDGLANLSDVAKTYDGDKNIDLSPYELDGKYYGLPYRQDVWVLFYNKDMFNKAGVSVPTDKWTWDDFVKTAQELKAKLPAAGYDANQVYPTYLHSWQSVVQGVATAQGGSDALNKFATGDFGYMNPFYETAMKVQNEGLALNYNIVTSNKTQYGAQFTSELAAMMPMGSWEAASVIDDAKTGVGHKFEWGMAPLPQAEGHDFSKDAETFGDPTGLAVSSKLSGQQLAAAKEFVKWASGPDCSMLLAQTLGTAPAYRSEDVIDAFFSVDGMPKDEVSRNSLLKSAVKPENPVSEHTGEIQSTLSVMHSAIMTGTKPLDQAIADAQATVSGL